MSPKDIAVGPSSPPPQSMSTPGKPCLRMQGRGSGWEWDKSFQLAKTAGSQRLKSLCKPGSCLLGKLLSLLSL